jgi:transcription elongation factor Elf1
MTTGSKPIEGELLPCPFCGKVDISVWADDDDLLASVCVNCEAFGPKSKTIDGAKGAWNTRALTKATDTENSKMPEFMLETGKLHEFYSIPMLLTCPACGERHIDEGDFAEKAHHTHACQGCGMVWRPAKVNTHGVRFLPGYSNAATDTESDR